MIGTRLSRRIFFISIIAVIFFHCVTNFLFLMQDTSCFFQEGGYIYIRIKSYAEYFRHGLNEDFFPSLFNSQYPPFYELISSLFYILCSNSINLTIFFTNSLFLIIFCLALYGIGKHYGNEFTGALTVLLTTFIPPIIGYSRNIWMDFAVASMTALSIFLYLKSRIFTDRTSSLLFAISVGISSLIKWSCLLNILAFVFIDSSFNVKFIKKNWSIIQNNVILSLFVTILMSGWWYILHLKRSYILELIRLDIRNKAFYSNILRSSSNYLFSSNYPSAFSSNYFKVMASLFLFCTVTMFLLPYPKKQKMDILIFALWLLSIITIVSSIHVGTMRHILGVFFIPPLIISIFITSVPFTLAHGNNSFWYLNVVIKKLFLLPKIIVGFLLGIYLFKEYFEISYHKNYCVIAHGSFYNDYLGNLYSSRLPHEFIKFLNSLFGRLNGSQNPNLKNILFISDWDCQNIGVAINFYRENSPMIEKKPIGYNGSKNGKDDKMPQCVITSETQIVWNDFKSLNDIYYIIVVDNLMKSDDKKPDDINSVLAQLKGSEISKFIKENFRVIEITDTIEDRFSHHKPLVFESVLRYKLILLERFST